jgi:hypothetical protein
MYAVRRYSKPGEERQLAQVAAAVGSFDHDEAHSEVLAWFARYDMLVESGELDAMADMATFPLNEVTDDAGGFGVVGLCDRERFLSQMREAVGGAGEVTMESVRHPMFISRSLCFVVTNAAITTNGRTQQMRYGDLLIRTPSGWQFQTMVASGYHAQI